jgi:hypothetical protein
VGLPRGASIKALFEVGVGTWEGYGKAKELLEQD